MKRSTILSGFAGLAAAATPSHRVLAQAAPIRLGIGLDESYCVPLFAANQGFFGRAGLDVELTSFASSAVMRTAVLANSLDVGQSELTSLANAVSRDVPLTIIAGGALYRPTAPTAMICVAKNSTIRTAKELDGQTVAVINLQSLLTIAMKAWMQKNNADPNAVKFYEMPFPPMAAAVARGTVAAALMIEPFLSAAKAGLNLIADPLAAIAPAFYTGAYFTSRSWFAANQQLAKRLADSLYQAAAWANANHHDSAAIEAKEDHVDTTAIEQSTRTIFSTSLDPRYVQPVIDVAVKYGALDREVPASALLAASSL